VFRKYHSHNEASALADWYWIRYAMQRTDPVLAARFGLAQQTIADQVLDLIHAANHAAPDAVY
jgi:hypothetical protein